MQFKNLFLSCILLAGLLFSCKTQKNEETKNDSSATSTSALKDTTPPPSFVTPEEIAEEKDPVRERYQGSAKRVNDILHTKLEVDFNYKKTRMNGKATLDIKPYFYSVDSLILQAKGFDIHKVQLIGKGIKDLLYTYDSMELKIALDRKYTRDEKYQVYIEYTAKPNERKSEGSAAITGAKGLYFINPDSSEVGKHVEIWTQGETEASSCWFPTIDRPNEKMTHEILITVCDEFKTLSNGSLIKQTKNKNGTRTDHWKMSLPHTPYLVMMAIGDYSIVKDTWKRANGKTMEVSYYVEKEYEAYARDIFGETPAMIEFFSKKLGVEYPWEKYSQIVVRDYVSGAMENTTATIHGEFLYKTKRELIDGHNESIIAHELFHHWFGDLVTCESWANLPLNESFANYSQFLWDEFRHGADEADHHALSEMNGYLMSSQQQGYVNMIRFNHGDKEEMFDAHSYNKGGRILHMLRTYVGDDAFFEALKLYLTENQYQPAEMHELRLAFEKVTGEDLNWFFNQWFFDKGHPDLEINYQFDKGRQVVIIRQKQNFDKVPLYKLPIDIDLYLTRGVERHRVTAEHVADTFYFYNLPEKPWLVNVDATKTLLCTKEDNKDLGQYVYQYYNAPKYLDRLEAIKECGTSSDEKAMRVIVDALGDKYWNLRETAMKNMKKAIKKHKDEIKTKLITLAGNDPKSDVRAEAIKQLSKYFETDNDLLAVYQKAIKDESYEVMAQGMKSLAKVDSKEGLALARSMKSEKNGSVKGAVAEILVDYGTEEDHPYFEDAIKNLGSYESFTFLPLYAEYLKRQSDEIIWKGIAVFENFAANKTAWYDRFMGLQSLSSMQIHYTGVVADYKNKMEAATAAGNTSDAQIAEQNMLKAQKHADALDKMITDIRAKEDAGGKIQIIKED
jgi:aminopeptidase N